MAGYVNAQKWKDGKEVSGVNLNATKGYAKLIKILGHAKGRQMERRMKPSAKDSGVGTIKEALDVL